MADYKVWTNPNTGEMTKIRGDNVHAHEAFVKAYPEYKGFRQDFQEGLSDSGGLMDFHKSVSAKGVNHEGARSYERGHTVGRMMKQLKEGKKHFNNPTFHKSMDKDRKKMWNHLKKALTPKQQAASKANIKKAQLAKSFKKGAGKSKYEHTEYPKYDF